MSYTDLALALTAFNVVSAVLQTPAGFLVDRIGARVVLIAGVALGAAAFAVAGLVHSFAVFVAMFAVAGLGNTAYHPADYSLLSQYTPPSRIGQIFSFHTFAGILGSAVAPATLLAMQSHFGWRGAFVGAAILGAIVLALLIFQWPAEAELTPQKHRAAQKAVDGSAKAPDQEASWRMLLSPPIMLNLGFFILISIMGGLNTIPRGRLGRPLRHAGYARERRADRALVDERCRRACRRLSCFADDAPRDGCGAVLGVGRNCHAADGHHWPFGSGADYDELAVGLVCRYRQPVARHAGALGDAARRLRKGVRLRLLGLQYRLDDRADDLWHD